MIGKIAAFCMRSALQAASRRAAFPANQAAAAVGTTARCMSSAAEASSPLSGKGPLNPFHIAVPVHDLDAARRFYGEILGCEEGRSAKTWIDWNLGGHQLVTHFASKDYRGLEYYNDVDKDMVPVPHFGICLTVPQFKAFSAKLKDAGIKFLVEPHVRFEGKPGEQWTMFFKDPSGNSLEFKAMSNQANLFAKYYVD